jgi:hypothetical protein
MTQLNLCQAELKAIPNIRTPTGSGSTVTK